jgi:DNA-binding LytR/AlgR family response regulator
METLLGKLFFRCHRCYLVNLDHIQRYNTDTIWLKNGTEIMLAQKKYAEFVKTYLAFAKSGGLIDV